MNGYVRRLTRRTYKFFFASPREIHGYDSVAYFTGEFSASSFFQLSPSSFACPVKFCLAETR
jgi:hypothetical protein